MTRESILLVDDEEDVLNGLRRVLHASYAVDYAVGAEAGLRALREKGPFAVVVSDMRMPGMNGAAFLAKARGLQPHATRMLLTGYSDAAAAAEAVNQGHIFRFLSKPCPRDQLASALDAGIENHRRSLEEKALLENTLLGSIRTLSEVLSVVNPLAFERATRLTACVKHLLAMTVLEQPWQVEAAASLSQIGCLDQEPNVIHAMHRGQPCSPAEHAKFHQHPLTASQLLAHVPRLEGVAWIIRHQQGLSQESLSAISPVAMTELRLGAEMLRMAIHYDTLWLQGKLHTDAISQICQAVDSYPHALVTAIRTMKPREEARSPRMLAVQLLSEGMILDEDILNPRGTLLVGAGQPVSKALTVRLREYSESGLIGTHVRVLTSLC